MVLFISLTLWCLYYSAAGHCHDLADTKRMNKVPAIQLSMETQQRFHPPMGGLVEAFGIQIRVATY
jgi:hypothetical protein